MVGITKSNVKKPFHSDNRELALFINRLIVYRTYDAAYREMTVFNC